jgi:hypothetical protein
MSAEHVNTTSTKNRNAGGAPVGNQNHLTHGVFKLEAERKRGQIDRRTSPYRLMKKLERSVESNFTESRKKWHRSSIARGQYYVKLVHEHVLTLKHVTRKGRVHPAVELLLRLSLSVDGAFEALGNLHEKDKPVDLARRYALEGNKR